jgi:hypothetical protein
MYTCNFCAYSTNRSSDFDRHNNSNKHIKIVHNHNILTNEKNNLDNNILSVTNCNQNVTSPNKKPTKIYSQIDNFEKNPSKKNAKKSQICQQIDNFETCDDYNGLHEKMPTKKKNTSISKKSNDLVTENDNDLQKYTCECSKTFNHRQNLWRHQQKCTHKTNDFLSLKNEILELKCSNVKLQEEILELKSELFKYTSNQINNTTNSHNNTTSDNTLYSHNNVQNNTNNVNNNQKFISVFNYVSSNYTNAPKLQELKVNDVKKLLTIKDNSKYPIEEHIIFHYKKHSLDRFLGEIIKGEYKTDDPEEQQFWTTNVTKLTFMIKKILKTEYWMKDMKGAEICRNIINPILKEIKKMLQKYTKCKIDNVSFDEIEELQSKQQIAVFIIRDIDEQKLQIKILNYIAPHFQLQHQNEKNLLIDDGMSDVEEE